LLLPAVAAFGQDVDQTLKDLKNLPKQDPVSMTGSINASSVFYNASGIKPRRDPFYWVLNANLNFMLFDKISVPFSATITQQDKNFTNGLDKFSQPFNQFGLSPRYKWLTLHAGFRVMDFSEYTYSGTMFLGGGVEVKPEKGLVSGSAFYGRLVKAVPVGGVSGVIVSLPAYNRMGGGGKVRVGNDDHNADIIFFRAKDDKYSIPFDTAVKITPAENQVFGLSTKQKITKIISFEGDFAYSMYTDNLFEDVTRIERFTYVNQIYSPRSSTTFSKAITAMINFSPEKFRFGFKYKRIDPDYRTMGAIFLTNDVEEYSFNNSFSLIHNKLNISSSIGLQQNNLDRIQSYTSKRIIGSLNTSYNFTDHFNCGVNYSNFSSNTVPVRIGTSDTIKLVQLTQSGGLTSNYSFGKKEAKHSFNFTSNYQESGGNKQQKTNNLTASVNHSIVFQKPGFTIATGVLVNQSNVNDFITQSFGPTLSVSKGFFNKKLRLTASGNYQVANTDGENIFNNLCALAGVSYVISKWSSFKMDYNFLQRQSKVSNSPSFAENRLNVSLLTTFKASGKKMFKRKKPEAVPVNETK
jgi:hypothetical protein